MKVFVAGASGAIGRPLVRQLAAAGHEVVAATRSAERGESMRELGVQPAVCDALDAGLVLEAVGAAKPDVVVNQLTAIPPALNPRKMAEQFAPTNKLRREGTANLMAAAKEHGVRRVISQSVAFAYASTAGGAWTEEDRLFTEAGEIVQAVEALERQTLESEGVEGLVLRYGFFYGPGSSWASDGPSAGQVRKRQFPIIGSGEGVWPWIHVDDAAGATVAALDHGGPGIYNVVDDDPARLRDWLPYFAEVLGAKKPRRAPRWLVRIAAGPAVVRYGTELQPVSNEKAKRELGWRPRWSSWRQGFKEALG